MATPSVTPNVDSGASAPAATPQPSTQPSSQPASQPSQGGQPQPSQGIEQLRTAYDTIKKEYEPWKALNVKPEQVTQFRDVYQRTYDEVASIGRELGYPDEEIIEAIRENPIATLDYLRNEARQREAQQPQPVTEQNLRELVESRINDALSPIQERENVRLTGEANSLFERTVYQMASDMYKQGGVDITKVPQDEVFLLTSATSEILKYDEDALKGLKYQGQTAPVQKAFAEAKTMLDKYYLARSGRERGIMPVRPGQPQPPSANGGRKPSLDELINSPELINQKYAER